MTPNAWPGHAPYCIVVALGMSWSPDQQLRLQNLLNGVEHRPSIHDRRFAAYAERGEAPETIEAEMTFDDFVDVVNPLHHIPIVGHGYRAITDDQISPHAQVMGDILFGGPTAIFTAGVNAAIQQETGRSATELAVAAMRGDVPAGPSEARPRTILAQAPAASMSGQSAGPAVAEGPAAGSPVLGGAAAPVTVPRTQTAAVDLAPAIAGQPAVPSVPRFASSAPPPVVAPGPAAAPTAEVASGVSAPGVAGGLPGSGTAVASAGVLAAPRPGAIAVTVNRPLVAQPMITQPAVSGVSTASPVAAGPAVSAGPQMGQGVAPSPAAGAPSGPVEISTSLDAALMALAGGGAPRHGAVGAAPVPAETVERQRQTDTAYRRTAGAVATYGSS